jgi:hypothetical protein
MSLLSSNVACAMPPEGAEEEAAAIGEAYARSEFEEHKWKPLPNH